MSTTTFGKAAIFFSVSNDECTRLHTGDEFEIILRQKMQRSLPERQTEGKNRCLQLPRHTGNPQLKYWKASATTAWNTKSTRPLSLVSPYEKTGDSRFAPNLLPYTGVRAVFFRGHVSSCEKGLLSRVILRCHMIQILRIQVAAGFFSTQQANHGLRPSTFSTINSSEDMVDTDEEDDAFGKFANAQPRIKPGTLMKHSWPEFCFLCIKLSCKNFLLLFCLTHITDCAHSTLSRFPDRQLNGLVQDHWFECDLQAA